MPPNLRHDGVDVLLDLGDEIGFFFGLEGIAVFKVSLSLSLVDDDRGEAEMSSGIYDVATELPGICEHPFSCVMVTTTPG